MAFTQRATNAYQSNVKSDLDCDGNNNNNGKPRKLSTNTIFLLVFITLFIDLLAFTLILPLMPKIFDHYTQHDSSGLYRWLDKQIDKLQTLIHLPKDTHNGVLLGGLIGSWFSLLQFLSSPFFGALSDRYGRKPILLIAMSGTVISYFIWYMSPATFVLFLLSRTIGGLSKSNVSLSLAIITDASNSDSRGRGMAIVGSSFSLAFIIGPMLGALFSSWSTTTSAIDDLIKIPAAVAIALSSINLLLVSTLLPETRQCRNYEQNKQSCTKSSNQRPKTQLSSEEPISTFKFIVQNATQYIDPRSLFTFRSVHCQTQQEATILRQTGFIYFLYLLFYSGLEFTLSFLTHLRFNFTSMDQGKLYLFSGIIMSLIQGGYIRRVKPGKEARLATIGLVVVVPSFIMMALASSVAHIYGALILYAFSSAVIVPCLTTIVSSQGPPEQKGAILGVFRSIGALARAVGPTVASICFWTYGSVTCYCGGALAICVPIILMLLLNHKLNQKSAFIVKPKEN